MDSVAVTHAHARATSLESIINDLQNYVKIV
jgi:hypothetical protein